MRFLIFSLLINESHPITGQRLDQHQKIRGVLDQAELAERLGFHGFMAGERHGDPFLCSAPPVLLSAIAQRTSRLRLFTGVTVLSIHDPVRVAEDYATVDHLCEGRLEIVIGKGNHAPHYSWFGLDRDRQWDALAEKYALLRRLWSGENVHWSGAFRAPLENVTTQPRPFQEHIRVWHGSATSRQSTELAARHGDPLYSANGFFPVEQYVELIDHYRERWAHYGHPGAPTVASGFPVLYMAKTSQEAIEGYRPYWDQYKTTPAAKHNASPFDTLEEFIERGSALVGSPEQILDKLHRYQELLGHELTGISVEHLPLGQGREQMEWFAEEIASSFTAPVEG